MDNKNTLDGVGDGQLPLEDTQLPVKKEGKLSILPNLERKNRDIKQSHVFTTAKYSFDAYEKRILYRTVEYIWLNIQHIDSDLEFIPITLSKASVLPKGEDDK